MKCHLSPSVLQFLNDSEIEAVHQATLRILWEVGVVLTHPEGRERLMGAGAVVHGDRVRIPPDLVEWAVAQCPRQVTLRRPGQPARDPGDGSSPGTTWAARDVYDPALASAARPRSRMCGMAPACWTRWTASPQSRRSLPLRTSPAR